MQYHLRVLREGQAPYSYGLEAQTPLEARLKAEQQGLTVLDVKAKHANAILGLFSARQSSFPLILFCQEFRVLFEAGLSVTEVLQTLLDKETDAANKDVLQSLVSAVQEGKTLSQGMGQNAQAFPALFVSAVAAAETTGDLAEALLRFSQYLENVDLLKKRVVSATLYPAIVTGFGLLVLIFLIVFVIPKFSNIYATQIKSVSVTTQFLLDLGVFSKQYGLYILALLVSSILGLVMLVSNPAIRARFYAVLWRLPYLGEQIRVYYLSRFYRTFSMLLKSGIPVMNGLTMVDNMLGEGLSSNLQHAKQQISEGKSFSDALQSAGLATMVAIRLFNVGEKTGKLDHMMECAAAFHEEQLVRWIDRFTKVFEPTLMAVIGLLIGGIVMMMYLPIFELASGIE
jgi:general secretion pathway protein F